MPPAQKKNKRRDEMKKLHSSYIASPAHQGARKKEVAGSCGQVWENDRCQIYLSDGFTGKSKP